MVSFVRKLVVVAVFLLGLIVTIISWLMFHDSLGLFVSAAITCVTLLVVVAPKEYYDLCISAMFIFFDVGLYSVMFLGKINELIAIFGLAHCLLLVDILMFFSGVSIYNKITNFVSLRKAFFGNETQKSLISKI